MDSTKHIIEINGVKMEIDTRQARRIDTIKVGTRVKVLQKKYGDTFEVKHGVVIGFEPFKELPTIIIAVAAIEYNSAKVEFVYFNTSCKDIQLVVAYDDDLAALDKNDFTNKVDAEIAKKELEILDLRQRRQYFLDKFACYWAEVEQAVANATAP